MDKKEIKTIKVWEADFPPIGISVFETEKSFAIARASSRDESLIKDFAKIIYSLSNGEWIIDCLCVSINGEILREQDFFTYNLRSFINKYKRGQYQKTGDYEFTFNGINSFVPNHNPVDINFGRVIPSKEVINNSELYLNKLRALAQATASLENKEFYYYQISIPSELLFQTKTDNNGVTYKMFVPEFLEYIRFINLSNIDFSGVSIEGLDLSYTNISQLSIMNVYKKNARNTNLSGVLLKAEEIKNADLRGSNLSGTNAIIDLTSVKMDDAVYDETAILFDKEGRNINKMIPNNIAAKIIQLKQVNDIN